MPRYLTDDEDEEDSCPECGGELEENDGDRFCLECGYLNDEADDEDEEIEDEDDGW